MQMGFQRRSRFFHASLGRAALFFAAAPLLASPTPIVPAEPNPFAIDSQLNQQPELTEATARLLIIPQMLPDTQVEVVTKDICEHIGLACNFDTFAARVPNAMAYMIDGKRVVMYNPEFIGKLERDNGEPSWATLSVLVHEIGHHLLGHMFANDGNFPARELEADRFSGFMLYRMGSTLNEAKANINAMAQENETPSHPGRSRRLIAIEEGWTAAKTVSQHEKELAANRAGRSNK